MVKKRLKLVTDCWHLGSYRRGDYKDDILYTFYQYREVLAVYSRSLGLLTSSDGLVEQIFQDNLISPTEKCAYAERLRQYFERMDAHDDKSVEQMYEEICVLRKDCFGTDVLEEEWYLQKHRRCVFEPADGIDQRKKKEEMFRTCTTLLFILCQPELSWMMEEDIERARYQGKEIYLLIDKYQGIDLEDIPWDEHIQDAISERKAGIFFYGEEGLLHCRSLLVDAIVHGIPSWYHTRALTNRFGIDQACVVYVPAGLDITRWVTLTERSRLTYWQLAKLWEVYGDEIYTYSPETLYQRYPAYFVNVYENGGECPEAGEAYPICVNWVEKLEGHSKVGNTKEGDFRTVMRRFDCLREKGIRDYLNSYENLTYHSTYFDEHMNETNIVWDSDGQQSGIMVHAVKVKQAGGSQVINCERYSTLRELLKSEWRGKNDRETGSACEKNKLQIFSNFLFFLTPKLARLYNDLRSDRPAEQIGFEKMHLDYMLYKVDGKRVETFPLFRKACIAMKDDGKFLFFNFRLGVEGLRLGRALFHGRQKMWMCVRI